MDCGGEGLSVIYYCTQSTCGVLEKLWRNQPTDAVIFASTFCLGILSCSSLTWRSVTHPRFQPEFSPTPWMSNPSVPNMKYFAQMAREYNYFCNLIHTSPLKLDFFLFQQNPCLINQDIDKVDESLPMILCKEPWSQGGCFDVLEHWLECQEQCCRLIGYLSFPKLWSTNALNAN